MEDLTKSQLILLALLVSFVGSIATSIMTVSLLSENNPQAVGQTINRVVERTIEKVIPQTITQTITKEVKVPANEGEAIVKAVASADEAVLVFGEQTDQGFQKTGSIVVFAEKQLLVTSGRLVNPAKNNYVAVASDGKSLALSLVGIDTGKDLVVFRSTANADFLSKLPKLILSKSEFKSGETLVGLGAGEGQNNDLSIGFLLSQTATSTDAARVKTNAAPSSVIGGPILNVAGEVAGLVTERGFATPARLISALIDSIK